MQNKQLKNILEKQGKTPVVKQSIKPYNFERFVKLLLIIFIYLYWFLDAHIDIFYLKFCI